MIIEKLKLENFRSFKNFKITFDDGLTLIKGTNGIGKTNIVEAINYFSYAKSFRTSNDIELINNKSSFSFIEATFVDENTNIKKNIKINISKKGKNILINDKKINKVSALNDVVDVIIFSPIDSFLLKGVPENRKRIINEAISKIDNKYFENLIIYKKLLKERNNLLKEDNIDFVFLEIITKKIVDVSFDIFLRRKLFYFEINKILNEISKELFPNLKILKINYKKMIDDENKFKDILLDEYKKSLNYDLKIKHTSIGIHKEDFEVYLDDKNIGLYGSQGENRISSLLIKLSLYFLKRKSKPIIILDDVLSELDEINIKKILTFLEKFKQVFITATDYKEYKFKNIYEITKDINKEE